MNPEIDPNSRNVHFDLLKENQDGMFYGQGVVERGVGRYCTTFTKEKGLDLEKD